jgi:hypothetical protein
MRRGSRVGVILLLALGVLAVPLQAQSSGNGEPPGRERGFQLGPPDDPGPSSPETRISFTLFPELFEDGQKPVVTIRIYNILRQLVAIPVALNHPAGAGVRVDRLVYDSPGRAEAFWDGRDRNGNKVTSGVYIVQLDVNGEVSTRRIHVAR